MFTLCFRPGGFMTLVEIPSTYITMEGIAPPFILTFLVPKHKKIDIQIWRKDDFEWISQNGFWRYQSTDPIHSSCDQLVICFSHTRKFFALVIEMKVCLLPVLCPTHLHSEPLLSKKNKEWTQRNYQQPNAGGTTWQGARCHRGYSRTLQGQNRERLEELVLNVVWRWA